MTTKPEKPRDPKGILLVVNNPGESPDKATARYLTQPQVQAAATIQAFEPALDVNYLETELAGHVASVNDKNLARAEAMLISQATTLDTIFNGLARKSRANMECQYLDAAETYLRLALKAQAQCRASLETLAALQNPPVVYAKQANFAAGNQRVNVNNGVVASQATHTQAGKTGSAPNELLKDLRHDQITVDAGTPEVAAKSNRAVEAVGKIHRAAKPRGKVTQRA